MTQHIHNKQTRKNNVSDYSFNKGDIVATCAACIVVGGLFMQGISGLIF